MKAALVYARMGWKVVPLHSVRPDGTCTCPPVRNGKPFTCHSAGKHPRPADWVNEASNDAAVIAEWQAQWPDGNVGIATGNASGFFVLDVDPKNGGDDTLAELLEEHGPLPVTPQQATPSGGAHYLFRMPGRPVSNAKVGRGLDIRGDGGQIVAAPSRTTAPYRWVRAPWETPMAEAPAWLLERLGKGPSAAKTGVSEDARGYFPPASPAVLDAAREALEAHGPAVDGDAGGLHTVHAAAILTHDFALTDEEAWPLFEEWNETCVPPWEPDELRERLRRGRKYGKAEYGCKRALDTVERSRKLIHAWRAEAEGGTVTEAERERSMDAMIQACRELVRTSTEPAHRERIQNELIAATGLGALALALPRVRAPIERRAEPSQEPSIWTVYGFELGTNGAPVPNMDNVVRALEHEKHPVFFEVFSQRIQGPHGEWSDADDLALALHLQRDLGLSKVTPQIVNNGVQTYARGRSRDVVREYLERLTWDGTPRIARFLADVYGAPDDDYSRAASANFWKSIAARVLQPGCKVDHMLVLEGSQGIRKSTSAQVIAGAHLFAEASESPTSKDFFLALQGKLIVEVAEMDSFSRAEVAAVKRVLTCRTDRFRAPYERSSRDWPRRGVFIGTTNRDDWARDDTGGRRFWPIRCSRVDVDYINANREQLFAEAVARVKAGERWWEMPDEATKAEQEARRQVDPWEELIGAYVSRTGAPTKVTTSDVLRFAVNLDPWRMDRAAEMRAASVLKRLKFVKVDGWHEGRKAKFWRKEEVGSA